MNASFYHSAMRGLAFLAASILPVCLFADPATMVGSLPGNFSVDNRGAASYSISLPIPPGRGQMRPDLSINYNSHSGAGPLGIGFSISTGFPQGITRGRSILARDGIVRGITFTADDKFYMDGKRLVLVSQDKAYGEPGSTYRLEVDSFDTIAAYGSGTIETFIVRQQDGTVLTFGKRGADSDAMHTLGGGTGVFEWKLKSVEDLTGNDVTFNYNESLPTQGGASNGYAPAAGESILTSIAYTGNYQNSITPQFRIKLLYNIAANASGFSVGFTRPDAGKKYMYGRYIEEGSRLDRIYMETSGQDTRIFDFKYSSDLSAGCLRLDSLKWQESGVNETQATVTEFKWGDHASFIQSPAPMAISSSSQIPDLTGCGVSAIANRAGLQGDFNGDGRQDILLTEVEGENSNAFPFYLRILYSEGDGGLVTLESPFGQFANPGFRPHVSVGDFNGDGLDDIAWSEGYNGWQVSAQYRASYLDGEGNVYVSLSTGIGFGTPILVARNIDVLGANICAGAPIIADINGDGLDDLVIQGATSYTVYTPTAQRGPTYPAAATILYQSILSASGSVSFTTGTTIWELSGASKFIDPSPTDVDNDGLVDFIVTESSIPNYIQHTSVYVVKNLGNGQFVKLGVIAEADRNWYSTMMNQQNIPLFHPIVGDVNGDGLPDILVLMVNCQYTPDKWVVALAKGDGGYQLNEYAAPPVRPAYNGSTLQTWQHRSGGYGMGTSPYPPYTGGQGQVSGYEVWGVHLSDYNGDGLSDLVFYDKNAGWFWVKAGPTGFGSPAPIFEGRVYNGSSNPRLPWYSYAADVDGNGRVDMIFANKDTADTAAYMDCNENASSVLYVAMGNRGNLTDLIGITDGFGSKIEVAYRPITNNAVYTQGGGVAYPIQNIRPPQYVVSEIFKDVGANFGNFGDPVYSSAGVKVRDVREFSYQYSGRRTDLSGRGDLGFHSFVTLDHQTNLFKYQFLTQSFPMTGLTAREQTYRYWESGGNVNFRLISSHDNTVVFDEVVNGANTSQAYGTVFPFISKAVESRWENSNTPHFTLSTAGSATAKPEALFPAARPGGAHITIGAQSWFDNQPLSTLPPSTLPGPYYASDRTTEWSQAGTNVVAGMANYAAFDALNFPRQITYGNLRKLETDFGGGFTEKLETTYESPTTNGLTGRVDTVTTTVTSPDYSTEVAPIKSFDYWSTPGGTPTPLVASETIDASDNALDLTTMYGRDSLGRVTSISISGYNNPGHPQHIGSYTVSTVQSFDARFDLPTVSRNAYGHETTVVYHPFFGLPTSVIDANGAEFRTGYDALGRVIQTRDILKNLQTDHTYALRNNALGYKVTTTSTAQPTVTKIYDRLERSVHTDKQVFNGDTLWTGTDYNALGQVVTTWDYDWRETTYTYDALGRVSTVRYPSWALKTSSYLGRVTQVAMDGQDAGYWTGAGIHTTTTLVDAKGRTVKVWNADNVPSSLDPVTGSSTEASIEFKLDGFGRMRQTILKNQSQAITAGYDALGRQTSLNDPDKGSWTYVNNALGQLVSQTDAKSNVTISTFDKLGRPLTRRTNEPAGGAEETASWYYYDLAGNVGAYPHLVAKGGEGWVGAVQREESLTAGAPGYAGGGASTAYYYDSAGRISTKLNNIDGKWFYTWLGYDSASRLTDVRHYWRAPGQENPGDPATSWESYGYTNNYNERSYLTSVVDTQNRTWWEIDSVDGYEPYNDFLSRYRKGSGYWTFRWQDWSTQLPVEIASDIHHFMCEYDGYGNLRYRELGNNNNFIIGENFSYDIADRLTHRNGQQITSYHPNGNIDWKKDVDGNSSASYAYDPNKPHAVTSAWGYTMSYDNNGNLLTRSSGSQTWTTKWAGFDKPRWLAKGTSGSEFHYNANRSRVIHLEFDQMSGNAPSHYKSKKIYAAGAEMEVDYKNTSPSGVTWQQDTVRIFIPAPDGIAGTREFRAFAPSGQQEKLLVYHYDTLGSIMAVTPFGDTSGNPALDDNGKPTSYSYDAWGQRRDALSHSGSPVDTAPGGDADVTPRGYTGHEMLDGLDLVHMNGRIYDPLLGRFLSADVLVDGIGNLQGYNRYSYVQNNPLSKIDPTGHVARALPALPRLWKLIFSSGDEVSEIVMNGGVATHAAGTTAAAANGYGSTAIDPQYGMVDNYYFAQHMAQRARAAQQKTIEQGQVANMEAKNEAQKQDTAPKPEVEKQKPQEGSGGGQLDPQNNDPKKSDKDKMAEVRAKGKEGESQQQQKITEEGQVTTGKQVTFESTTTGRKARLDATTTDGQKDIMREAKKGPTAELSPGQRDVQADVNAGKPVIPRGENAKEAGYEPGKPRIFDEFVEDRF